MGRTDITGLIQQVSNSNRRLEGRKHVVKAYMFGKDDPESPVVAGRPAFVWVREQGMNGGVFQAFNVKVNPVINLPVLLSHGPKPPFVWEVIDADWRTIRADPDYNGNPFLPAHGISHEWPDFNPGTDPVTVYPRALAPLRITPGTANLTVDVGKYVYDVEGVIQRYLGQFGVDIAPYVPVTGMLYLLVYFDKATGVVGFEPGETVAYSPVVDPPFPELPSGTTIPSAVIFMYEGMLDVVEADILDVRMLFGGGSQSVLDDVYAVMLKLLAIVEGELDIIITKHVVEG